jgi:hypothetical protein
VSNTWRVRFADGTLTESQSASGLLHKIAAQHWSYKNELTDKENILLRLHEIAGGWIDPELDDYDFLMLLSEADLLQVKTPSV